jgi:hypothetical protein
VVGGLINWQLRTALRRSTVVSSWLLVGCCWLCSSGNCLFMPLGKKFVCDVFHATQKEFQILEIILRHGSIFQTINLQLPTNNRAMSHLIRPFSR